MLTFVILHLCIHVVSFSTTADATSAKQTDDEFMVFDDDISVKMPLSIINEIKRVPGERYRC